jgi:drug/metabolite transporter (DMT)-like permease
MEGVLWGLGCALSWSIANLSIGKAARRFGEVGALAQSQILGALAMIPAALWLEGLPHAPTQRGVLALLAASFAALIAYVGLFTALGKGRISIVIPVMSAWAAIGVLTDALLFEKHVEPLKWVGVGLVVAGNATLAASQRGPDAGQKLAGAGWALVGALGFGLLAPAVDQAGAEFGRLWALPGVWLLELFWGAILWRVFLKRAWPPRATTVGEAWLAGRAGVIEALGFVFMSLGIGYTSVAQVVPAASLSTAFSVTWGLLLLRERPGIVAVLGALLASVGVVITAL